ncbi:uncharacterized protein FIBRA_06125 [Fibroporia radiculosa]|uniref:Protein-S-isoprenylcysteine O-methyltransferase n=1 Tax=Fibroporia radiculosa TaxID=599839 RepID=J4H3W8_9APHY|nr:uncharacterized protein FIBRA_06125 [Fibroporia radiculosa]CCM03969.1 predicted protein [Fibroporia radiculosa]
MTSQSIILKLIMLFSAAYFSTLCGRSPQPTPKRCEESKFSGLEMPGFRTIVRWLPQLVVTPSIWMTLFCHAASALCTYKPHGMLAATFPRERLVSICNTQTGILTFGFVAGWLLIAAGTAVRITCYRQLGRYFTFELAIREGHELITTGPYSIVRHPAYSGSIMALTGVALIELGPGSWWADMGIWTTTGGVAAALTWLGVLGIMSSGIIIRTAAEDRVLSKEFGEQWDAWARNTRYKLCPTLF